MVTGRNEKRGLGVRSAVSNGQRGQPGMPVSVRAPQGYSDWVGVQMGSLFKKQQGLEQSKFLKYSHIITNTDGHAS